VFQAFFVSYLVEPGYGEKIATLQELLDSSVNYGFNLGVEFGMSTMEFTEHLQFPLTRRVDCVDLKTCLMRMMSDGDVATMAPQDYAEYISKELGYQGEMKDPCSLDENFIYGSAVFAFTKGYPLVNQFNSFLRRVLKSGVGWKYWEQLGHEALLRSRTKSDEDGSSMYFVFTLSHMGPAFSVFGFGYLCCTILCIAECLHQRLSK
jgi:hypothetical protein